MPELGVAFAPWLLGPSQSPDPSWEEEGPEGCSPQPRLSPQYGKKKRRYLPYNHQHLYFFLSECLFVLLEVGAQLDPRPCLSLYCLPTLDNF